MAVASQLKKMQVAEAKGAKADSSVKLSNKALINFFSNLRNHYQAGTPINSTLQQLSQVDPNKALSAALRLMVEDIENGKVLSEAMMKFPNLFGEDIRALIRAAEYSGNWTKRQDRNGNTRDGILDMLVKYLERRDTTRDKVKSGMTYPLVVLLFCIGASLVFMFAILPKLREMFNALAKNADPGMLPRAMFWLMDMINNHWLAFPIVILVIGFLIWDYFRSAHGKELLTKAQLKSPVIGNIFTQTNVAETFWLMGCLFAAGMTPQEVLDVTIECSRNKDVAKGLTKAKEYFHQGINFAESMRKGHEIFDGYPHMILASAQKTGHLGTALQDYAEQLFKGIDQDIERLVKLIEPAMLLVVGVVVGVIVISYYSGLSNLVGAMSTNR
jgi:type IV pilus assembly protein PilC